MSTRPVQNATPGEPCKLCGKPLTDEQTRFVGFEVDGKVVHKECWYSMKSREKFGGDASGPCAKHGSMTCLACLWYEGRPIEALFGAKETDAVAARRRGEAKQPVPIGDLQARLNMLRRADVREYRDGDLHIILAPERPVSVHTRSATQGILVEKEE